MATPHCIFLDELPLEGRTRIDVSGADSQRFLQGLLSADVASLATDTAVPAALLTAKGKLISDAIVFGRGAEFGLLVPQDQFRAVAEKLDKHIIMDEVELDRREDQRCAMVFDSASAGGDGDPRWLVEETPGVTRLRVHYPMTGTLCVGARDVLEKSLEGVPRASGEQWAACRVAEGIPAWGHEVEPGKFPPEVGFVSAVSYDKGCYLGQEPLARIHARGQVKHVMVRVESGDEPDSRDLTGDDDKLAGIWTTWAEAGGLAVINRRYAVVGTELRSASGATVTVTSGPLGDDAGA